MGDLMMIGLVITGEKEGAENHCFVRESHGKCFL